MIGYCKNLISDNSCAYNCSAKVTNCLLKSKKCNKVLFFFLMKDSKISVEFGFAKRNIAGPEHVLQPCC